MVAVGDAVRVGPKPLVRVNGARIGVGVAVASPGSQPSSAWRTAVTSSAMETVRSELVSAAAQNAAADSPSAIATPRTSSSMLTMPSRSQSPTQVGWHPALLPKYAAATLPFRAPLTTVSVTRDGN